MVSVVELMRQRKRLIMPRQSTVKQTDRQTDRQTDGQSVQSDDRLAGKL